MDDHGNALTSTNPAAGAASWSGPAQIDPNASLRNVFCLSAAFCIAGDDAGRTVTTTNPAGGPPGWSATTALTGGNALNEMSCPSGGLCVALDDAGRILTSNDPAATQPTWDVPRAPLDSYGVQASLSCASTSLCLAFVDFAVSPTLHPVPAVPSSLLSSTHPTDGASAWTAPAFSRFYGVNGIACPSGELCVLASGRGISTSKPLHAWKLRHTSPSASLSAVSCAASALCAATTNSGNVVTSTDPTGGQKKWSAAHIENARLEDVSCSSGMMCAALDTGGNVFTSVDPTGGRKAWTSHNLHLGYSLTHIACPSISLCVGLGADGNIVWSTNQFRTWTVTSIDPGQTLTSLSCPSAKLCVVGDDRGNVMVGTGPGPNGISRKAALAALKRSAQHSCIHESARQIGRHGGCPTAFGAPGPGQVTITWLGARGQSLASGQLTTTQRGRRTVHVALTPAGRRLLRGARHTGAIRIRTVFVDAAGHRYQKTATIRLAP